MCPCRQEMPVTTQVDDEQPPTSQFSLSLFICFPEPPE